MHAQLTVHTVTGSIGVRLAAAGALLAVLAGCGGEDERSAFSGCLPHVLNAVEATAAAAAHAVAAAAHSNNSSAASGVYALCIVYSQQVVALWNAVSVEVSTAVAVVSSSKSVLTVVMVQMVL
jgi:hypothetical protein